MADSRLIVVADDEPHIRLLIEQSLEDLVDEGVEILTVGDGAAALAEVKAQVYRMAEPSPCPTIALSGVTLAMLSPQYW